MTSGSRASGLGDGLTSQLRKQVVSMETALIFLIFFSLVSSVFASSDECVILLHGLGRTSLSMKKLEKNLEKKGYLVWNEGYPSREKTIEELASVVGEGIGQCRKKEARKVHFVTHSLGGILVRQYFQDHNVPEARRVVMLGPPNHGSGITDRHRDAWWYKEATGPAGQQLGTGPDSLPNRLAPLTLEIGIIAGTSGGDLFSSAFKDANDGKVSVESTKLGEMKDFLVVDTGHTFIMNSDDVIGQVLFFLKEGRFNRPKPALEPAR
jgi:pimeloyl-ACP methyl ester carboxylesterase